MTRGLRTLARRWAASRPGGPIRARPGHGAAPPGRDGPRLRSDRRGVAAIEFAIVGPVAFLMIFAIVEVGRLAASENALEHAVQVAGRWAAINSAADTASAVTQQFDAAFHNYVGGTNPAPSVTVAFSGGAPTVNGTIQVSAAYVWTPLFTMVPFASVPLSVATTLPIIH